MRRALALAVLVWAASCSDQSNPSNTPAAPGDDGGPGGGGGDDGGTGVTGDPKKGILLKGTVLGPSGAYEGEVLVVGDTIICADKLDACEQDPKAAGVAHIDVDVVS